MTTFDAYTAARRRLGTERTIVAQPTAHGVDNRVALDAVARLADWARAVVVVDAHTRVAEPDRPAGRRRFVIASPRTSDI